ncbi:MAG: alternative ribosome rescue aminoacyl-tRNA hydrolase ArfB [Prolixibacteraceae bacterium]|jgi:ribosome-associated protein|nr:alternative ribosome rescue aminoacyl-tRNA hydrolase ArfB [Prolixibacteraceae bacterium]
MYNTLNSRRFDNEFVFSASRSSGPGGQNVNKVNSKVELRFNVANSSLLSNLEKHKIAERLKNRINSDNELIITAQSERSQLKNKEKAIDKFYQLISMALQKSKNRKPTRPTRSSVEKRLTKKKRLSEKKSLRKKP